MTIAELLPPVIQVAYVLFLFAALFADVLLIRICLALAFVCLLLQCVVSAAQDQVYSIDAALWAVGIGKGWTLKSLLDAAGRGAGRQPHIRTSGR